MLCFVSQVLAFGSPCWTAGIVQFCSSCSQEDDHRDRIHMCLLDIEERLCTTSGGSKAVKENALDKCSGPRRTVGPGHFLHRPCGEIQYILTAEELCVSCA